MQCLQQTSTEACHCAVHDTKIGSLALSLAYQVSGLLHHEEAATESRSPVTANTKIALDVMLFKPDGNQVSALKVAYTEKRAEA